MLAIRRHLLTYLLLAAALLLAMPAVLHSGGGHKQKAAVIGWCVDVYPQPDIGATVCLP